MTERGRQSHTPSLLALDLAVGGDNIILGVYASNMGVKAKSMAGW